MFFITVPQYVHCGRNACYFSVVPFTVKILDFKSSEGRRMTWNQLFYNQMQQLEEEY